MSTKATREDAPKYVTWPVICTTDGFAKRVRGDTKSIVALYERGVWMFHEISSCPMRLLARTAITCGLMAAIGWFHRTNPVLESISISNGALRSFHWIGWLPWKWVYKINNLLNLWFKQCVLVIQQSQITLYVVNNIIYVYFIYYL